MEAEALAPNQANRPFRYQGIVRIGDKHFGYATGGWDRGSMPWGTFRINVGKGDIGPVGQHIGAIATVGRLGGELDDPKFPGRPREGIQIHPWPAPTVAKLSSQGCFTIWQPDWFGFKAAFLEEAKKGQLYLTIEPNGNATIKADDGSVAKAFTDLIVPKPQETAQPAKPAEPSPAPPPAPAPSSAEPLPQAPPALQSYLGCVTIEVMRRMWPHGDQHVPGLIEGIVRTAPAVFAKYGFHSKRAIAMAMAQFSEECGSGLEMEENMNYSAERLLQVFPTHFSRSSALEAAHNPRRVADVAYGGRMGNAPPPSDDGWNYRGRGFSQVTGKENYAKLAQATGLPLLAHPELLSDPEHVMECGIADYVKLCGCLPSAEAGDIVTNTRHLNGGLNGLSERRRQYALWCQALHA